jgi:MazG family protein
MQGDSALGRAVALVRDLRTRCPWDAAQTPQTLRPYLVEEALELDQAIRHDDRGAMRDELGDLLLNVAFQIVIAEERGWFSAEDVTRGLEEKMWRRHPHLFGLGEKPPSWEHGKRRSREQGGGSRTLQGLPETLPPLLMACRLQERAAGVGFDWPDPTGPLAKVKEETAELEREVASERTTHHAPRTTHASSESQVTQELGDLLFSVVNLARKLGVEPSQALERANDKFRERFAAVERLAAVRGLELGRATLEQLDALWDEVKGEA